MVWTREAINNPMAPNDIEPSTHSAPRSTSDPRSGTWNTSAPNPTSTPTSATSSNSRDRANDSK